MMKNAFGFTLKALFVPKIFQIFLDFLVMYKSGLTRKIRFILKSIASQPKKQITAIHTLPKISISKANQNIKFGHLIECNMRNIFLKKLYTKCGGDTNPRPFP